MSGVFPHTFAGSLDGDRRYGERTTFDFRPFACLSLLMIFVWLTRGSLAMVLVPTFTLMLPLVFGGLQAVCRCSKGLKILHPTLPFLFLFCRIGEASNPGPSDQFEECQFSVGTFNPSGLRNKAQYFSSHLSDGDIWTVSETHFFGQDVSKFRTSLRATQTDHRYFISDQTSMKPCLINQHAWKGVAVISKHPTRGLPSGMPECILNSGRALLATTLISDTWISGGVVSGEPDGHSYPHRLRNTECLLHHVASHVCHLTSGLRYVAGDWNVSQDTLPAFEILNQAGFRDVQDIACDRWGIGLQNTCKNRTRKDFLYISPELQELLTETAVLHDVWPDHSVIVAKFRSPLSLAPIFSWPSPTQFPWPSDFGVDVQWNHEETPTVAYQQLWQAIETDAVKACPFVVHPHSLGKPRDLNERLRNKLNFSHSRQVGRTTSNRCSMGLRRSMPSGYAKPEDFKLLPDFALVNLSLQAFKELNLGVQL